MKKTLFLSVLLFSLAFMACKESYIAVDPPVPDPTTPEELYYTNTLSYPKQNPVVYRVNDDGSGNVKLVANAAILGQPYGGKFSFALFQNPSRVDLMLATLDSLPPKKIFTSRDIAYNALSPDGRTILYVEQRYGDHHGELHIVDVQTGSETKIMDEISTDVYPSFSPDSKRIAFVTDEDHSGRREHNLMVTNTTGGQPKFLTDSVDFFTEQTLSWTADNSKIVVIRDTKYPGNQVYLVSADGISKPQKVTNDNMIKSDAVISPAGDNIIYRGDLNRAVDLYQIPVAGGSPIALTMTEDVFECYPQFSNDGSKIVFSTRQRVDVPPDTSEYKNEIRVMNLSTKVTTIIANYGYRAFWKK